MSRRERSYPLRFSRTALPCAIAVVSDGALWRWTISLASVTSSQPASSKRPTASSTLCLGRQGPRLNRLGRPLPFRPRPPPPSPAL